MPAARGRAEGRQGPHTVAVQQPGRQRAVRPLEEQIVDAVSVVIAAASQHLAHSRKQLELAGIRRAASGQVPDRQPSVPGALDQ